MRIKRNGHASFPRPIRLYSWRQRVADNVSAWVYVATCVAAFAVLLLDLFVWRPN